MLQHVYFYTLCATFHRDNKVLSLVCGKTKSRHTGDTGDAIERGKRIGQISETHTL